MKRSHRQILLSKRANIFYIDRAKIVVDEGCVRICSSFDSIDIEHYLNLPDKNTSLLLLGHGTSITNEASRLLSASRVMVGFCGTGGTPLYNTSDMTFFPYNTEYQPTKYMQEWIKMWLDDDKRLAMGKLLLNERIEKSISVWENDGIHIPDNIIDKFENGIKISKNINDMLLYEARWVKALYAISAKNFTRDHSAAKGNVTVNRINKFLNHGNYLAYGCAAVVLTGMGISYAFPILHGKTRRGGLVFDIADLIKDAYVLPFAFESKNIRKENIFRGKLVENFQTNNVLDYLFDITKQIAEKI